MGNLNILYLTPIVLFKDEPLLLKQWKSIKTLIPCFLRSLYKGDVKVKLHEFDKVFTGLKNVDSPEEFDVLAKVASAWYYLTRLTHQSVGPRMGKFAEEMIKLWIEEMGCYSTVYNNITLGKALEKIFGLRRDYRGRVDFVTFGRSKVSFIELRMSEHTGGRTGQESLLDKFNKILDLVKSKELVKASLNIGVDTIELIIAILFNENQELIERSKGNFGRGRINSLINYILEKDHIWGRISKIKNEYVLCESGQVEKSLFEKLLSENYRVCLTRRSGDFKIHLKILLGDEFFKEVIGYGFKDLINKYGNVIADDLWIMYTLVINELKLAKEFGKTNVLKVYEVARTERRLRRFFDELRELYRRGKRRELTLKEYIGKLNEIIKEFSSSILNVFSEHGEELRLLETNDIMKAYRYLRYVCVAVLSLYLVDRNFSKCRWED